MEVNNYQTPLVGEFKGVGTLVDDNLTGRRPLSHQLRTVERSVSDCGCLLCAAIQSLRHDLFALLSAL
jgi:hypothetical protein